MEIHCEKCNGTNIVKGKLLSTGGVVFVPDGQKSIVRQSSGVVAFACKDCGCIFNIRLEKRLDVD